MVTALRRRKGCLLGCLLVQVGVQEGRLYMIVDKLTLVVTQVILWRRQVAISNSDTC